MKTKHLFLLVLANAMFIASGCTPIYAQDATGPMVIEPMVSGLPETSIVTLAQLTERRETAAIDTSLTKSQKAIALALFDRAIQAIHTTEKLRSEATAVRTRADTAPARISRLSLQLERAEKKFAIAPEQFAELAVEEISALAERARRELDHAHDRFYQNRVAIRQLSIRPVASIGSDGTSVNKQISLETDQRKHIVRWGSSTLADAREYFKLALRNERFAERDLAREWLANFDHLMRLELLELDVALLEVNRLTAQYESLKRAVESVRMNQAREERENAEVEAAAMSAMPEAMRQLADENLRLRKEFVSILELEVEAARLLRSEHASVRPIEVDLEYTQRQLGWIGPNLAMGQMIRDHLEDLPSIVQLEQAAASRQVETERAVEVRIGLERIFRKLILPEPVAAGILTSIPQKRTEELGESWLRNEVSNLLAAQRKNAKELYTLNGRYLLVLTGLSEAENRITLAVRQSIALAADELLWIPGMPPFSPGDLSQRGSTLQWLLSADSWVALLQSAFQSLFFNSWVSVGLLAILMALVYFRPRFRRALVVLSEQVQRIRTDAFRHTLSALVFSFALAAAWPFGLVLIGWLVRSDPGSNNLSVAIGHALIMISMLLFSFSLARWIFQPRGLSRHFRWPETVCSEFLDELRWFVPVFISACFLVALSKEVGAEDVSLTIGRPALIVSWILTVVLVWRLLGPSSALNAYLREAETPTLVSRWRFAWVFIFLFMPLLLALISALGYQYAAVNFSLLFLKTLVLIAGLLLLRDLLMRWFYVAERRMRLESMLRRREEARAERERLGETEENEGGGVGIDIEEIEIDYRQLGDQGRAFIRVGVVFSMLLGLWFMWGELLPAITLLDRVELPLTHTLVVDGLDRQVAVTLADLVRVLIILAIAFFASKNLAGLLGFTVLRPLRFDAGASYAIVTLCQYVLLAAAVVYAFSNIGLEWSKLQWLVAALGVGLGFGLQEIVANFVSGIILLLERPVRVGDIVTVGDADGYVARIRIRATTIVTWEGKELVVPNKEFITQRVLNWTLSNSQMRLYLEVGVAYGNDIRLARELVLEALDEAEHLLKDPSPIVTFGSFGDNALNLEIRCFLPDFDHWHSTRTEIHNAIYEKFAKAGITIAFPQRDVHLDVKGPLDVQLRRQDPQNDPA
jgi:potassium efflux system protein